MTAFKKAFPEVRLKLLQGNPHQLARHVLDGEADLAIATEALADYPALVTLPCYQWHHCVVVPPGHALATRGPLTLEAIAEHPIVTYDPTFAGRTSLDRAFAARGLAPDVVLSALDSDVIKSYVALDCEHLFPTQTTRIAFKRGAYLRGYTVQFIRLFAPHLEGADLKALAAAPGADFSI